MSDQAPLKESDFMSFEDAPNPGRLTRRIVVYSKSQGFDLGSIHWYSRWRQYVFEPSLGTLFNVSCLADLADCLGYLNTMHKEARRRPPTSPAQATPSASPRELSRAADSALAQEIADREGDRKKIKALEVIAADKVLLNEQVAVLEDDIEGYEEAIRGLLKRIAVLEARIEALESDKAAMRLEIVTIIGMYGDHMHPRVKQALEAVAVAYPPAALAAEEKRP